MTCLFSVGFGVSKGFGIYFGKLIRFLILIFTVMLSVPPVSDWAASHLTFAGAGFWDGFFFLLFTAAVLFVFRKTEKLRAKKGPIQFHPFWDRVIGAATGFFFALLLVSFISQFLLLFPGKTIQRAFKKNESRYGVIARNFVPQVVDGALAPVRALVNRKVGRSLQ